MSFFTRLFGLNNKPDPMVSEVPSENGIKDMLEEAKRKNKEAADTLADVANRQVKDAELIRQVIHDILDRADKKKAKPLITRSAR